MAGKRKCICCGKYIGTDEKSVPYKNRYAHIKCFQDTLKSMQKEKAQQLSDKASEKKSKTKTKSSPKPKAELKDAVSEEEYAEKKQYYQYLRSLIHGEMSAKIYALSDQYISRYNFTFKNMYQTLVYLNEIIEKELDGDVVGLIPYYYTEAEKYYNSITNIEENNKNVDTSTMYQEKIIYIQPKTRKNKQIDISSIGKEEDNV